MSNLDGGQILITIGAGGVGKTTAASAIGLYLALHGYRTLVITVDPAQRLADALSLHEKSTEPKRVDVSLLTKKTCKKGGELFAFMPDLKKEWADFLASSIDRVDTRHEIASNHFYQYMVGGLPGAFEIICSHVLFRLMNSNHYDKIILDTPPSSHSVSFFDVPHKISRVLEQGIFRALMKKRHAMLLKITKKLAFFSGGVLEKTLERLIGSHFFSELIDFALTIDALYEPLLHRVKAMDNLLKSNATKYLLVLRPTLASINDGINLKSSLKRRGIRIDQVVLNQVMKPLDDKACMEEMLCIKKQVSLKPQLHVIEHAISLYQSALNMEKHMLEKMAQEFSMVDRRILYATDQGLDRAEMLARLVNDLDVRVLS